jgi:hypothetical protein
MCRQCHAGLSDETVKTQLQESLDNPEFEKWSTTSLSHVLIAAEGTNGPEARVLALELAENFYAWFLGQTNGAWQVLSSYTPNSGLEPFPHSSEIRRMIDDARARGEKLKNRDKLFITTLNTVLPFSL